MGRDNEVIKKQIQLKNQKTSDKFIRKLIEIKENIWGYVILKPRDTKLVIQLQVMEDWTYWKFRPHLNVNRN
jgi:hypothetical protein